MVDQIKSQSPNLVSGAIISGFRNLDLATGGFHPKDLIIFPSFFEDEIR